MMCQGTFANAHFAGKLQADRVWEEEEENLLLTIGKAAVLSLQCGPGTQITWYNIPSHCKKLFKVF